MIDILQLTIPALLVLATAYFLLDKMLKNDEKRRNYELKLKNSSTSIPLRLRAYERLMLVVERTKPTNIVIQTLKPAMSSFELQTHLLASIREEFGHNASQQIYVSNELWTAISATKESLIQLINISASQCDPNSLGTDLAEKIIQLYAQSDNSPGEVAANMLKNEVRGLF